MAKIQIKTLIKLADELEPIIKHIINLDGYKDIKEYVQETYKEDKTISGKTIIRILQIVENDLLETYVESFMNKGLIEKYADGYEVVHIFDGLQLRMNEKITEEILNECRLHTLDKTGYDIQLKMKPFDSQLELPENLENDNDLTALLDTYETGLNSLNRNIYNRHK